MRCSYPPIEFMIYRGLCNVVMYIGLPLPLCASARYLQHGPFSFASTVMAHAKVKSQNEVVGSLGGRKVGKVPKGTVTPRRMGRERR
jgi:hypothetical protein